MKAIRIEVNPANIPFPLSLAYVPILLISEKVLTPWRGGIPNLSNAGVHKFYG